jgi:rod shape-determining protein MreD
MKLLNSSLGFNDYNVNVSKICFLLVGALALTILPLPNFIAKLRPNFVLLIVLYMQCCIPAYFRVTWVFVLGILLDVLTASTIGQHSLAFILTCWAANAKPANFRYYSILQQTIIIFIYCLIYQILIALIDLFFGINVNAGESFCVVLLSLACWPILRLGFVDN